MNRNGIIDKIERSFLMNIKVFVIDDEMYIVELLKFNLEVLNYEVSYLYDGFDGFIKVKEIKLDLIFLDWMLLNISGIEVLRKIRSDKDLKNIFVIMFIVKNMENDKVEGFEIGVDDYIIKLFSIKELLVRISFVLRRYNLISLGEENNIFIIGNLKLDLLKYEVIKGFEKIELIFKEFELLKLLI